MAEGNHTPKRSSFIDITGKRFGMLVVVGVSGYRGSKVMWQCRCDCGVIKDMASGDIRAPGRKSCGCMSREFKRQSAFRHGYGGNTGRTPEYSTWSGMLTRCRNPNSRSFKNYGGRGIRVCDRWLDFTNFLSDMGKRPSPQHTIERVDNNGDYCPENCIWILKTMQSRNQTRTIVITLGGRSMCVAEWSRETGIAAATIYARLKNGWSVERALTK